MLLTTAQLARKAKVSDRRIRQLIKDRTIKATVFGGSYVIHPDDAKRFLASRRKV